MSHKWLDRAFCIYLILKKEEWQRGAHIRWGAYEGFLFWGDAIINLSIYDRETWKIGVSLALGTILAQ